MYMLLNKEEALIIDPFICKEAEEMLRLADVKNITIILTHEHYDHISGINALREKFECQVIGNAYTKEALQSPEKNLAPFWMGMFMDKPEETRTKALEVLDEHYACEGDIGFDGEYILDWQDIRLRLIETPGHSPGSICILADDNFIFTGDSLVEGNKVITRLPRGSRKLYNEITQPFLEALREDIIVFPGHGMEGKKEGFELG